tara:strand:+ start:1568 stop:2872 length:1305 start_codon:yes stop_codon:yes gene_type:complete
MSQDIRLNLKQIFDLAFEYQNKKNYESARILYEKINEINPQIKNVQFNLGIIYEELNETKKAINCYEKVINIDPLFVHSYNNLGLIFQKLGHREKAIKYFDKIIEINPNYLKAYNNLGNIYADQGKYKFAVENYVTVLKYDNKNTIALNNLISALNHFLPTVNHPIIEANNKLKKINFPSNIENLLQHNNLKIYFEEVSKIKDDIKNNLKFLNFSESQAFRKNSIDLNCERHHKIFNKINIISNFCFSCYKIQIEPANVLELIKLFLIFDNLKLSNNNLRKCMIELRSNISGVYKGLIYCSSLEEAKKILDKITPMLMKNLKYKSSIKRGCSEFYKLFPDFKIVDQKSKDFMEYPKKWKKMETQANMKLNTKKLVNSLCGLSISDVLIINQWLNYANLINDHSFNEIGLEFSHSSYIHKKMSHQTEFRRKEFMC